MNKEASMENGRHTMTDSDLREAAMVAEAEASAEIAMEGERAKLADQMRQAMEAALGPKSYREILGWRVVSDMLEWNDGALLSEPEREPDCWCHEGRRWHPDCPKHHAGPEREPDAWAARITWSNGAASYSAHYSQRRHVERYIARSVHPPASAVPVPVYFGRPSSTSASEPRGRTYWHTDPSHPCPTCGHVAIPAHANEGDEASEALTEAELAAVGAEPFRWETPGCARVRWRGDEFRVAVLLEPRRFLVERMEGGMLRSDERAKALEASLAARHPTSTSADD